MDYYNKKASLYPEEVLLTDIAENIYLYYQIASRELNKKEFRIPCEIKDLIIVLTIVKVEDYDQEINKIHYSKEEILEHTFDSIHAFYQLFAKRLHKETINIPIKNYKGLDISFFVGKRSL